MATKKELEAEIKILTQFKIVAMKFIGRITPNKFFKELDIKKTEQDLLKFSSLHSALLDNAKEKSDES